MAYDHSKKCGNKGDLVKHAVITSIISNICQQNEMEEFVYFESHAGFPNYALNRNGEWEKGILEFWERNIDDNDQTEHLNCYMNYCLTEKPYPGFVYPGSTDLARTIVRSKGKNYRFIICDYQNDVCAELNRYFKEWTKVTVIRGNGLDIIDYIDNASLALIDPAYFENEQDCREISNSLKRLNDKNIPFMCWVPRLKTEKGEDNLNRFKTLTDNNVQYVNLLIGWENEDKEDGLVGCLITVSKDLKDKAEETTKELKKIMEWTLTIS